tara:strand:+ start:380 stop:727 length:348 start_codon:yes stop_codon:yes gene_type:complete
MAYFGENTCHAWANINCVNGQDTVRDSYNISSVTDIGTGRQQFNFSTNAINNDFAVAAMSGNQTSTTTAPRTRNPDAAFNVAHFTIRNINIDGGTSGSSSPVNDSLIHVICCADT